MAVHKIFRETSGVSGGSWIGKSMDRLQRSTSFCSPFLTTGRDPAFGASELGGCYVDVCFIRSGHGMVFY